MTSVGSVAERDNGSLAFEVRKEFADMKSDLAADRLETHKFRVDLVGRLDRLEASVAEVLRRLPEPG